MKKKLLYIRHDYHNKTKSNHFLQELLNERYDVETLSINPYKENCCDGFDLFADKEYDIVVIFQVINEAINLIKKLNYKQAVFFPMFDSHSEFQPSVWLRLKKFNIINFSRTLHEKLLNLGLSSYYIQYFPKPFDVKDYGSEDSVFFWQRITKLNINTLEKLFKNKNIKHVHIHKALDPLHDFIEPSDLFKDKITYSTWYDKKEDMYKDVISSAFYMASREYEGIGMSFLEAMSMGRCVISPDNPTMNEYIQHGETGFLYDLKNPHPVDFRNVRQIQQNAKNFIKEGHKRWEKEKYDILDWVESPVNLNSRLYKKSLEKYGQHSTKITLFGFLNILTLKCIESEGQDSLKKYYLFGLIPIMKISKSEIKTRFYLFGIFPIWKIVKRFNTQKSFFFSFLPVLEIKKD